MDGKQQRPTTDNDNDDDQRRTKERRNEQTNENERRNNGKRFLASFLHRRLALTFNKCTLLHTQNSANTNISTQCTNAEQYLVNIQKDNVQYT